MLQEHTPITSTGLYCKEEVHRRVIAGLEGNQDLRELRVVLSAPD